LNQYLIEKRSLFTKLEKERFIVNSRKQYPRVVVETKDGQVNATIYSLSVFKRLVDEHCIWILFLLDLPEQFAWKRSYKPTFPLRLRKLRENVQGECNRAWHKAYNCIVNGQNIEKGRKLVAYTFRYLNWGEQMVSSNKIVYHDCENEVHYHALSLCEENKHLDGKALYKLIRDKYESQFKTRLTKFLMCAPHKNETIVLSRPFDDLSTFVKENTTYGLTRDFSVTVQEHDTHVRFSIDREDEVPFDTYPMISLCNDIIVTHDMRPICPSINRALPLQFLSLYNFGTGLEITPALNEPSLLIKIMKRKSESYRVAMYWDQQWKTVWIQDDVGVRDITTSEMVSEKFWSLWMYQFPEQPTNPTSFIFDVTNEILLTYVVMYQQDGKGYKQELLDHQQIAEQYGWRWTELYACVNASMKPRSRKNAGNDLVATVIRDVLESYIPIGELTDQTTRSFEVITQNAQLYEFEMPYYHAKSHLNWFCFQSAMCCDFPSVAALPQDIHDAVLDYIRFGTTLSNDQYISSEHIKILSTNRVDHEGNAFDLVCSLFEEQLASFITTLRVLNHVYEHVRHHSVDSYENHIVIMLQERGLTLAPKDLTLKILGTACFSINKLQQRGDAKCEILRLLQVGQDVKKVTSMLSALTRLDSI
jgi:hypothetical protein